MTDIGALRVLAADLSKAPAAVAKAAKVVVAKTALDIERDAKVLAPVDTGALRASIGVSKLGPLTAEIGPTVNYGAYVEFGTSRMGPQPYMGPAADRNEAAFQAAFEALPGVILGGR